MDYRAVAELLAAALGAIGTVINRLRDAEDDPVTSRAKDALTVITAIVDTVRSGELEGLDPATARAELDQVLAALDAADSEADAALAKKFDDTGSSDG